MLRVQNISTSILRNVNHSFAPGCLHAILGPNGAGKTTLLKTLCGLLKPTNGSIFWQQTDLSTLPRSTQSSILTLVPQSPSLIFDYTVEEFVAMGRYAKVPSLHLIAEALEAVDGLQFLKRSVRQLSQGERQRIYIARALVTEAPVILFDEPTAHMDSKHLKALWLLMKEMAEKGKTVIVANHDLVHTRRYCEEAIILDQGNFLLAGPTREVLSSPTFLTIFDT